MIAPAHTHRARRPLITDGLRPGVSMCPGHTFDPAFLPAGAGDPLDTARIYGDGRSW